MICNRQSTCNSRFVTWSFEQYQGLMLNDRDEAEQRALLPDDIDESEEAREMAAEVAAVVATAGNDAVAAWVADEEDARAATAWMQPSESAAPARIGLRGTLDAGVGAGNTFLKSLWTQVSTIWAMLSSRRQGGDPPRDHGDIEEGQSSASSGIASVQLSQIPPALLARLAHVLLSLEPSPTATHILDMGVKHILDIMVMEPATSTLAKLEALVARFESFSTDERRLVQIDTMVDSFSERHAAAWIQVAFVLFMHDGHLPAVPQPRPENRLLERARGVGGVLEVGVGGYVPLQLCLLSPHLASTEDGRAVASSFAQIEAAVAFYFMTCDLGLQAHLATWLPPLALPPWPCP